MKKLSDIDIANKLINQKRKAESRGIEFNLSFKKMKQLWEQKRCYFTGKEFEPPSDNPTPFCRSIERLDPNKGYTDDNVVACVHSLNVRKGDLTPEEISLMYKALKKKGLVH